MKLTKLGTFWATWKTKLGIGLAILVALGIALFAAYKIGYSKGENISAVEISKFQKEKAELQTKVVQAQAKVDTRVVTQYVTKIAYQDKIVYRNRDIIRTVIKDRPLHETVSNGWVYAHNQSVLGLEIDPIKAEDPLASGFLDSVILERVTDNYAIGNKAITQLEALQQWITESWKAKNEAIKK